MKKYFFIISLLVIINVFGQNTDNKTFYGCYWHVGESVYYIISESNIVRLDFCDEKLVMYSTTYSYNNDTLIFNFRKNEDSFMNFENIWVRYEKIKFLDYESGEYIKINKETINRKLESFDLNFIRS